jgi:hypothetical protein
VQLGLLLAGAVTDIRDLLQLPTIEGLALEEHNAGGANRTSGGQGLGKRESQQGSKNSSHGLVFRCPV